MTIPADDLTPCADCGGKRHPLDEMVLIGPERPGVLILEGVAMGARVSYEVLPRDHTPSIPIPHIELLLMCEGAGIEIGAALAGKAVRTMGEYLIMWADKHERTAP